MTKYETNSQDTASSQLKIMVVDDHPALRAGLRRLIDSDSNFCVVNEADSGEAAYIEYRSSQPDVVVMDLSMGGFGGIEAIRRIRQIDSRAAILIFTVHNSEVLLERALEAGALGFVTKISDVSVLLQGITAVSRGQSYVSPDMMPFLIDRHRPSGAHPFKGLTQREFQVFQLLSNGQSLPECAKVLNLSSKTVSNHFTQIRNKLGVTSTAEMARIAIRQGLVEP
jgi:two-component system, NarL family, invasion response regulator UvrY